MGIWVFNSPKAALLGLTRGFATLILFNGVANAIFSLNIGIYLISQPVACRAA